MRIESNKIPSGGIRDIVIRSVNPADMGRLAAEAASLGVSLTVHGEPTQTQLVDNRITIIIDGDAGETSEMAGHC